MSIRNIYIWLKLFSNVDATVSESVFGPQSTASTQSRSRPFYIVEPFYSRLLSTSTVPIQNMLFGTDYQVLRGVHRSIWKLTELVTQAHLNLPDHIKHGWYLQFWIGVMTSVHVFPNRATATNQRGSLERLMVQQSNGKDCSSWG